jgi:hypothetical protein
MRCMEERLEVEEAELEIEDFRAAHDAGEGSVVGAGGFERGYIGVEVFGIVC